MLNQATRYVSFRCEEKERASLAIAIEYGGNYWTRVWTTEHVRDIYRAASLSWKFSRSLNDTTPTQFIEIAIIDR